MRVVAGAIATVLGLVVAAAGALVGFWLIGPDGVRSNQTELTTEGAAIATTPEAIGFSGELSVTAEAAESAPVFIGLAHDTHVQDFLADASYLRVTELDMSASLTGEQVSGKQTELASAEDRGWWEQSVSGEGAQTLRLEVPDGPYDLVIMHADGSGGLSVNAAIGVGYPGIFPVALVVLGVGAVAVIGGVLLIVLGRRRRADDLDDEPVWQGQATWGGGFWGADGGAESGPARRPGVPDPAGMQPQAYAGTPPHPGAPGQSGPFAAPGHPQAGAGQQVPGQQGPGQQVAGQQGVGQPTPGQPGLGQPDWYRAGQQPASPAQWPGQPGPGTPMPPVGFGPPDQTGAPDQDGAQRQATGQSAYRQDFGQPGFDRQGYDQPGFDRQGYDQPGPGRPGQEQAAAFGHPEPASRAADGFGPQDREAAQSGTAGVPDYAAELVDASPPFPDAFGDAGSYPPANSSDHAYRQTAWTNADDVADAADPRDPGRERREFDALGDLDWNPDPGLAADPGRDATAGSETSWYQPFEALPPVPPPPGLPDPAGDSSGTSTGPAAPVPPSAPMSPSHDLPPWPPQGAPSPPVGEAWPPRPPQGPEPGPPPGPSLGGPRVPAAGWAPGPASGPPAEPPPLSQPPTSQPSTSQPPTSQPPVPPSPFGEPALPPLPPPLSAGPPTTPPPSNPAADPRRFEPASSESPQEAWPPFERPGFDQPPYEQPRFERRPGFEQRPGFEPQPGFEQPRFEQPGFAQSPMAGEPAPGWPVGDPRAPEPRERDELPAPPPVPPEFPSPDAPSLTDPAHLTDPGDPGDQNPPASGASGGGSETTIYTFAPPPTPPGESGPSTIGADAPWSQSNQSSQDPAAFAAPPPFLDDVGFGTTGTTRGQPPPAETELSEADLAGHFDERPPWLPPIQGPDTPGGGRG